LAGQPEDLDETILLHRNALALRPVYHPERPSSLYNLANSLSDKFQQSDQRTDLDESITLFNESLGAYVTGHPAACQTLANLGRTLVVAHSRTHESEYLEKAMTAFRDAVTCESAPVSVRLLTAKIWARLANDSHHESALEAYHAAIELLPRLAMLGLDLQARQQALSSGSDGLVRNAAACAIRSCQYDKAVEMLEEGRAVFWSQALRLRTPLTDLRDVAPELEKQLRQISYALERGSLRDESRTLSGTPQNVMAMEREAVRLRRLNDQWLATLAQVRHLDGFQDFLRPNRITALQTAATDGPVVIVNTSESGCDALIMTTSSVKHVPLPELSFSDVSLLVKLIQIATIPTGRKTSLPKTDRAQIDCEFRQMPVLSGTLQFLRLSVESRRVGRESDGEMQPEDIFRLVLAILWVSAVEPVIRSLSLEVSRL
jgi:tetratricopeptide (TPR) repeat protein